MANLRNKTLALVPLIFLATVFWKPALFDHKTIIHGDSITDGLSLLTLQFRSLQHLGQLIWSDGVYGGHPIFAEGQGGFASPFNMISAWIVAPLFGSVFAMNLAHWLLMILAGIGVAGLCRSLGASRASSSFAAIAVVFSTIWIGAAQNMTISGALTWVPWAFWAMEEWLKRADVKSAVPLGATVAMPILSGYPQAFHGAVIYMALTLVVIPFDAASRRVWIAEWRSRAFTGIVAVLVCAGLSAVQWLPLVELTGLSHRSGGIGIVYHVPLPGYLRGLLFTWPPLLGTGAYFFGQGSLLVVVLASLVLVVGTPSRIKGHLLASVILIQLGTETTSPLFQLVYRLNLIPGLHFFRTVHLYINIAVIGFGVLAAFAIDGLGRCSAPRPNFLRTATRSDVVRIAVGAMIVAVWFAVAGFLWVPALKWTNFVAAPVAAIGAVLLIFTRRSAVIPAFMLAMLILECMNLRLHAYHFYDQALLAEPASAAAIDAVKDRNGDKMFDVSTAGIYGFTDSRDPAELNQFRRVMESICAMTNTLWGVRSMTGALALPMRRQTEVDKRIRDELAGNVLNPPGARLMDLLAVRFISADQLLPTPGLRLFWQDVALNTLIMENTAARPRFQIFAHHLTVESPDEALSVIATSMAPTLVIENPAQSRQAEPQDSGSPPTISGPPASFDILKARSTEYQIDITAPRPVWFFIADANYPGWKATLDGEPTPLFSAQVLGKAIAVPEGKHRLQVTFVSATFLGGLAISAVSVVAVTLALWSRRRRPATARKVPEYS